MEPELLEIRRRIEENIKAIRVQQSQALRNVTLPEDTNKWARKFVKQAPNRLRHATETHSQLRYEGFNVYKLLIDSAGDESVLKAEKVFGDWQVAVKNLLRYALNLLLAPKRPEFQTIKLFNPFYVYEIAKKLNGAEMILRAMGYGLPANQQMDSQELRIQGDVNLVKVAKIATDLVILQCDLELLRGNAKSIATEYPDLQVRISDVLLARAMPYQTYTDTYEEAIGMAANRQQVERRRGSEPLLDHHEVSSQEEPAYSSFPRELKPFYRRENLLERGDGGGRERDPHNEAVGRDRSEWQETRESHNYVERSGSEWKGSGDLLEKGSRGEGGQERGSHNFDTNHGSEWQRDKSTRQGGEWQRDESTGQDPLLERSKSTDERTSHDRGGQEASQSKLSIKPGSPLNYTSTRKDTYSTNSPSSLESSMSMSFIQQNIPRPNPDDLPEPFLDDDAAFAANNEAPLQPSLSFSYDGNRVGIFVNASSSYGEMLFSPDGNCLHSSFGDRTHQDLMPRQRESQRPVDPRLIQEDQGGAVVTPASKTEETRNSVLSTDSSNFHSGPVISEKPKEPTSLSSSSSKPSSLSSNREERKRPHSEEQASDDDGNGAVECASPKEAVKDTGAEGDETRSRSNHISEKSREEYQQDKSREEKSKTWMCEYCTYLNYLEDKTCDVCGIPYKSK